MHTHLCVREPNTPRNVWASRDYKCLHKHYFVRKKNNNNNNMMMIYGVVAFRTIGEIRTTRQRQRYRCSATGAHNKRAIFLDCVEKREVRCTYLYNIIYILINNVCVCVYLYVYMYLIEYSNVQLNV